MATRQGFQMLFRHVHSIARLPCSNRPTKLTPETLEIADEQIQKDDETMVVQLRARIGATCKIFCMQVCACIEWHKKWMVLKCGWHVLSTQKQMELSNLLLYIDDVAMYVSDKRLLCRDGNRWTCTFQTENIMSSVRGKLADIGLVSVARGNVRWEGDHIRVVLKPKDSRGITKEVVTRISACLRKIGCRCVKSV